MMQVFKTTCEDCGKELESRGMDLTGENEIIVDFIEGMDFYCNACDSYTYIEIQKYTRESMS